MTLQEAIENEQLDRVREILENEPSRIDDVTEDGVPLALWAAKTGNLALVRYLVEYSRASMNTVDLRHRNILHFAAMSGNVELNRYLVERVGMDITSGDAERITPYQIAWEMEHRELCAYYQSVVGCAYDKMYHNPIRTGMFPDPSVVRVGEDYYMVNSSFIYFPCIPVSHSKDLVHWEIIGHAITNPQWAKLDELEGGRGYWAPDISYDNGKFYITATYRLNDTGTVYRKQIVVSSEHPEGPYSKPAIIDEDGIDPSIFHENGRHYMLLNRGARILELSADCTRQVSEARLLYYGAQKRAPEGPHLLKKDGYYYLFLAEGGTGIGHRISVARSRTLMGNYEPCPYNPIMRQTDDGAALQRCGHGKPVCTQNGEWYMVYLCGRMIDKRYSMLGRETALDPILWTEDGWPVVNALKGPSVLQKPPKLPACHALYYKEETDDSHNWMSPRPPEEGGIVLSESGVRIRGSRYPLQSVRARNIWLRRQTDFCFSFEAGLVIPRLEPGQEAGITCYYDENSWVNFYIGREESYFVQVMEHIGHEDIPHEKMVLNSGAIAGKMILLQVETNYLKRSFHFELEQDSESRKPVEEAGCNEETHSREKDSQTGDVMLENVYYLCDEGISMGKRFTGAMVGIYAVGGNEILFADFCKLNYKRN
jgi:xylan 1,4-beta-xylosidase